MQNPLTLVIFGATGDLYQSKLAPSLFNMFSTGLLPNDLNIIGFARKPLTDSDFQDLTKDAIFLKNKNPETKKIQDFLSSPDYELPEKQSCTFQLLFCFVNYIRKIIIFF